MNFSRFLDIQSWWEVPSIAYFCSLFRTAFNLLDFDIEELEEALLTDGTEESASSLLTELIVRLLNGCLGNNDISAFNYQMYLRRLFRRKCQETGRYNPFNTDIDFQFLPLRTKVEILYALCDFRLDAEDVFDLFRNLEAESLRVEPLGWDDNDSAYWYFYGTRLYREDLLKKPKGKTKKKKSKDSKKRGWFYGDDWLDDDETERVWQVVCFTEEDWTHLTEKFSKATSKVEKELYRSLSQNFLPEIPRLFQEKERLQRKRLLELPRRTSSRVLQKIKQKEEENKHSTHDAKEEDERRETSDIARENRAKRRNLLRSQSASSESSENSGTAKEDMPQKTSKQIKGHDKKSKNSSTAHKGEPPPDPPVKTGRKTNNSLASATGQILIPDNDEPVNSTRKKLKTSQIFSQTDEDIQTDMYKVLEQLSAHEDAWPFMDPVEEEYAPNYYAVIRRPMDLRKMEERLDNGYYTDFSMFKADFKLIVNNCRLYNGQDNEYTIMVDNLQSAFDRLTEKYMHRLSSSDEEIAVEYQLPTPSRKHKLKSSESSSHHKRKKRKSYSDTGEPKSSTSDIIQEDEKQDEELPELEIKKPKESHRNKEGKVKKKRKGHHRHGKHSKNHKKNSHKSDHNESYKNKHGKKQKHAKNKDSKKSKQKKKKSKHHETEINEDLKRTPSRESLESSNRSRSASPLPSIHTPTPSPTELCPPETLEQLTDPDFYKDKYDKIKERRRHAVKDAWDSLFDYKQKSGDKQKQNLHIPGKDKNQKLRETIEKLKAKNEKYKESFNNLFNSNNSIIDKISDLSTTNESSNKGSEDDDDEDDDDEVQKSKPKKGQKKNSAKNESASEALEQAVKDISKWLDDAPKSSTLSSPCNSPAQTISTEEQDNSRLDDEFSPGEKTLQARKELSRKRLSSREPKLLKRREIQRTIERLQPGKSKGNLLTNISTKTEKQEEVVTLGPLNKARDSAKADDSSPKLSLGSVLPTVEFTLGNEHNFGNKEDNTSEELKKPPTPVAEKNEKEDDKPAEIQKETSVQVQPNKKDAEVETEPPCPTKPSQEKATPNLSAWFKAFGAPKNTPTTSIAIKKKIDTTDNDEKPSDTANDNKIAASPKVMTKYDSPTDPDTPQADGGDSPLPNVSATPRQRRTSTGSSVSERSSFSQDLDSPRHQMSHTSPLLHSPASPRTEDFQKITYPIINGSVRAGFYHDTTSIKSSPEKSCSPREASQSPYSPYSQHVYASNNTAGSSTPNYFIDHSKSPMSAYGQNPSSFYDTHKAPAAPSMTKTARSQDEYTASSPETYQQNQYAGQFPLSYSPYKQTPSTNYTQIQHVSQPSTTNSVTTSASVQISGDTKSSLFPVKKRTYNEPEQPPDVKDMSGTSQNKNDYQKMTQSLHSISSLSSTSVDDIALALSEKSELAKLNSLREKPSPDYNDRRPVENRDNVKYETNEPALDKPDANMVDTNKPISIIKKDNIDMVNMGYLNNENDRRHNGDTHEDYPARDISKTTTISPQKGYDVDAIAINLGINPAMQKSIAKTNTSTNNIPPAAHSQDRQHSDISLSQMMAHAHHSQYDPMSSGQPMSSFSINDIELANKKLFASNVTSSPAALDYGNWKMPNQIRKQDILPSDYSTTYSVNNSEKIKTDLSVSTSNNFNKNLHQQYNAYNVPRTNTQRAQEIQQNLPSELRIPNPRGMLKNDHINVSSSVGEAELINKNVDSHAKLQKSEKLVQSHPLVTSNPYKTPYNNHSSIPLESLRNLPGIPQMLERYTNEERYLPTFASGATGLYHDKQFQMAQMFNKNITTEVHSPSSSVNLQAPVSLPKDNGNYKSSTISTQPDIKTKNKRKKASESKTQIVGSQTYHTPPCGTDVLSSVKTSMIPGSAFNFGTTPNMGLGTSIYGDNSGFSIEDFRNTTANQLMAANYMVAAVARQQRNSVENNTEKLVKPAHQNSSHAPGTFPFIGHSQVRAGYPFVSTDPQTPLYHRYLQQRQEELLRQTGAQIMGLYPSGYPPTLGVRQPYDSINRPSWL